MSIYNISEEALNKLRKLLPNTLSDDDCINYYFNNIEKFKNLNIIQSKILDLNTLDNNITSKVNIEEENFNGSLMLRDIEILKVINNTVAVINSKMLPIYLRGRSTIDIYKVKDWLSSRILPLDRENSKKILNTLNLSQQNNSYVALTCKALSLVDCYWYRRESDNTVWKDNSLYTNSFSDIISEVAFTGISKQSIQGDYKTPELTGQGSYAKCWVRENNSIYLYKSSTINRYESETECVVSKLLDILDVPHVTYEFLMYKERRSCKCEIMTNEHLSIISFTEFDSFFKRLGNSALKYIENNWTENYYTMLLVDGIIHNIDRHGYNWGVLMLENGNIVGLHKLFDHNCSIWIEGGEEYSHIIQGKTLLDVGKYAYKKLGKPPKVLDLINWLETKESYKLFKEMYNDKDYRRQFIISRIKYIIE